MVNASAANAAPSASTAAVDPTACRVVKRVAKTTPGVNSPQPCIASAIASAAPLASVVGHVTTELTIIPSPIATANVSVAVEIVNVIIFIDDDVIFIDDDVIFIDDDVIFIVRPTGADGCVAPDARWRFLSSGHGHRRRACVREGTINNAIC